MRSKKIFFSKKLNAKVNIIEELQEFKEAKAKQRNTSMGKPTNVQKFLYWCEKQPKDWEFKKIDVITEFDITETQFKNLLKRKYLDKYKINQKDIFIII